MIPSDLGSSRYLLLDENEFINMRTYKLALLLKSDIKKDAKAKLLEDLQKTIGDVKETKINEIGEKKLAYIIKKEKKGDYLVIEFSADKINADADKRIGVKEEILRHLLIRVD